jgi:phosphopantothenoylcysteine decarboxylase / phosphopantothenate---cysteine ligase
MPAPLDGRRVVLGITGGIAAYKALLLLRGLRAAGADVQPVLTPDAERFVPRLTVGALTAREVLVDLWPAQASGSWTRHVELGVWADLIVIAPATAQTLAKLAHGFCDNLLTAICLSARCPVLVCPAMDHDMWHHPATQANVALLKARGVRVMPPETGPLASGLTGEGRLPEPDAILARIAAELTPAPSLAGRRVLVTAGPTREHFDPVRFLSNPSTGTMGFALAAEAARRGGDVTLVAGPVALETPPDVRRVDVTSADEMHAAVQAEADGADLILMTAAVADYAPAERHAHKVKKDDGPETLLLRRTPDILAELGARRREGQTLVGFAMETEDGEAHARAKLARKRLDYIVLNLLNEPGAGFGTATNRVTIIGADGSRHDLPLAPKAEVAARILDVVAG